MEPDEAPNGAPASQDDGGYTPRVILVTGGAGFIGSHIATRLLKQYDDYIVVVLDKLDHCSSMHNLEDVVRDNPRFKFIHGNVLDSDLLAYVLQEERVDTVMHFAAHTHVDASFGNSLAFTTNNMYGTHVLLEACRVYGGVKRLIIVSTDEVFGATCDGDVAGLPADSTLAPANPYSAAKAGAELMALAYQASYKLPIIMTRSNNVYGPRQFPEKLIPKFILLASRGERLPVHGDGRARRAYLYVDDVAEAFDLILHKGEVGEIYNIGSQATRSVLDVASDICCAVQCQGHAQIDYVHDRAFNDTRSFICDPKLAALGWQERTAWKAGLQQTISWYNRFVGRDGGGYWDKAHVTAALEPHAHPAPFAST
ncbi:hypothetical protein D9Q98_008269 [Chlorella vulgaris]|uniref:NAD(P)-binding domain-containing protein n=1 Tax=Chlorella vulgaris TaxID=3077 RepID=A0A9D4YTD9_CHLVU|nr:hypothetical protein D9Q98_008269 [Chlorella vulgaris]